MRGVAKKTTREVVPPSTTAPPPRERHRPAWYRHRYSGVQHATHSLATWVEQVSDGHLRLPRFQRPWVWTDEQVIRLFDSFVGGYHSGSLLVWERYGLPPSVERFADVEVASPAMSFGHHLVVDGQQRIGAIATVALSGRFWFDLDAGELVTAPGPWRIPAGILLVDCGVDVIDWAQEHAAQHGLRRETVLDAASAAVSVMSRVYIGVVRLGSDWTLDRVMESFRRLNTEGTRMDAAELEAALARAAEGGE